MECRLSLHWFDSALSLPGLRKGQSGEVWPGKGSVDVPKFLKDTVAWTAVTQSYDSRAFLGIKHDCTVTV